ncbi:unnamed protein product [Arctia plantaginis]|uniref:Uncharacterized protein n=1 Tax=Arctia plantaginis TaxID=874455 RepID=A0A8S0ZAD8_ARCPL|nr:unnamed protein product [Arctia plantaginis]
MKVGIHAAGACEGSLGAASLGANRDAPVPRMTSSVRSDERPLATQGDMLNSIKFERRFREAMLSERPVFEKNWKPGVNNVSSRTSKVNTNLNMKTDNVNKPQATSPNPVSSRDDRSRTRSFFSPSRPMSPKGRRNTQTSSY